MMLAIEPTISRLPASVLERASTGAGERVRGVRQQQHHRRHVRDEVRQHRRDGEEPARVAEVDARDGERCAGARGQARLRDRVVHHEQADEEHQQVPVDEAEQVARGHAPAGQQHGGAGERQHLSRHGGEEEAQDEQG